jgi:hypothetical protein
LSVHAGDLKCIWIVQCTTRVVDLRLVLVRVLGDGKEIEVGRGSLVLVVGDERNALQF